MIFFITVLRALAACIITNSHYTGVYPTDLIANGGLLGDVIFFAVSGFCLINVKERFPKWYLKRLIRIYPAVLIITTIYVILGFHTIELTPLGIINTFIFPTNYHFVGSIILLYIPFYFVMKIKKLRSNIPVVALVTLATYVIVYIFFYDKTYYHIDTVREPMIRFLFFFSMLLGAYFRENLEKYRNKNSVLSWCLLPVFFVLYFASKMIFSKVNSTANLQIINQIVLFALLVVIFRCFCSLDNKFENMPKWIKTIINFISGITLEIYLVQIGIINKLNFVTFPFNWFIITGTIILLAFLLNKISSLIQKPLLKIFFMSNQL